MFVLVLATRSSAQNKFPGHGPDLLGIYPGMPVEQARVQMQKRTDSARVQDVLLGLDLAVADRSGGDHIEANVVGPPNAPIVWRIMRTQGFGIGNVNPMSLSALLSSLHAKYGMETASNKNTGAYYWLWDSNGNPISSNDPKVRTLIQCTPTWLTNSALRGDPIDSNPSLQTCYSSFVGLIVLAATNGPVLMNYTAELANMPLGYQAAMNIMNAKNAAARKTQQDQINKANQNKPTF
jgi:hypothetical protein